MSATLNDLTGTKAEERRSVPGTSVLRGDHMSNVQKAPGSYNKMHENEEHSTAQTEQYSTMGAPVKTQSLCIASRITRTKTTFEIARQPVCRRLSTPDVLTPTGATHSLWIQRTIAAHWEVFTPRDTTAAGPECNDTCLRNGRAVREGLTRRHASTQATATPSGATQDSTDRVG
ncbi:hypothetical protein DPEC_G00068380 [Dallia pectoralis]|uniref:Uncharacterized protein n=1 Tax=Dallia pectoralis TaxID=75939 RepID=A0ACC2H1Q5_DALPE|nr:hypothetical protein DPEC_G00068380 [Dallia pectoralis]